LIAADEGSAFDSSDEGVQGLVNEDDDENEEEEAARSSPIKGSVRATQLV
jgi:hypothetical protein